MVGVYGDGCIPLWNLFPLFRLLYQSSSSCKKKSICGFALDNVLWPIWFNVSSYSDSYCEVIPLHEQFCSFLSHVYHSSDMSLEIWTKNGWAMIWSECFEIDVRLKDLPITILLKGLRLKMPNKMWLIRSIDLYYVHEWIFMLIDILSNIGL